MTCFGSLPVRHTDPRFPPRDSRIFFVSVSERLTHVAASLRDAENPDILLSSLQTVSDPRGSVSPRQLTHNLGWARRKLRSAHRGYLRLEMTAEPCQLPTMFGRQGPR